MNYILNIETATKNCSVSIAKDGETIICKELAEEGYSHAEYLHVFIEDSLKEAGIAYADLSAIAVSQGPGSYTGLRIGVSAAKGLCFAIGIPLIAVDTMKVLAAQASVSDGLIVSMLDARRMEVYSAVFDSGLQQISGTKAEIITNESYSEFEELLYFVGDCEAKCSAVMTKTNFKFLEKVKYPSAREMSLLSFKKFLESDFEDLAYFEPYYLKDFIVTVSKK